MRPFRSIVRESETLCTLYPIGAREAVCGAGAIGVEEV